MESGVYGAGISVWSACNQGPHEEEKKKIASTLGMLNAMPTPSQTQHAHAFNK